MRTDPLAAAGAPPHPPGAAAAGPVGQPKWHGDVGSGGAPGRPRLLPTAVHRLLNRPEWTHLDLHLGPLPRPPSCPSLRPRLHGRWLRPAAPCPPNGIPRH